MFQTLDPAVLYSSAAGFFPFIILITSLLGSWHCAGMCGPIACSTALKGQSHLYHFGRALSYSTLGFIAGASGHAILSTNYTNLRYIATVIMALILLSLGIGFFFNWNWPDKVMHNLTKLFSSFFKNQIRTNYHRKFILGLSTIFLPCGWLYSFVLIAASTKSAFLGTATMFIFWVGTVPALTLMSAGFTKVTAQTQKNLRKLTGVFFLIAGLYSLMAHLFLGMH